MSAQAHNHTRIYPLHVLQYPYHPMDRRFYDEDGQPLPGGAPQQHSPDDVLLWLDSLSGQAPDPTGNYNFTGQWLSEQAYAQIPPQQLQQFQQFQQFQQGSSTAPVPQGTAGQPVAYPPAPPQSYDYDEYDYDYEGSAHSETESAAARRRIALDPSQPLTVDGNPRARVFVACDRCRVRKLRCDGAKPVCYHCQKAAHTGAECKYDATPKRRGQDKAPRTRSAVGTRKPRRPAVKKDEREAAAEGSQSQSQGSTGERR